MTRTVNIPPNVDVDDHVSVLVIPKATLTDPESPSVAILAAAPEVAHEFTPDGFAPTSSQTPEPDPRFALKNVPQRAGTVSHTLAATYYFGEAELELDPLLKEGDEVYVVVRDAVPILDDYAAAQTGDIYACEVGHAQKNRPTNGRLTKTTPLFVHRKFTDVVFAV